MTQKAMIEEMAKEIFNTCAWRFGKPNDYKEICKDIAEDLIKLGYTKNKIPEDSVVLTKEEYEKLCHLAYFGYEDVKEQARKETAKEILKEIMSVETEEEKWLKNEPFVRYVNKMLDKIQELAKQFGVGMEE